VGDLDKDLRGWRETQKSKVAITKKEVWGKAALTASYVLN